MYLHLPFPKGLRQLPLRYQDVYLLFPHSLLLRGSLAGLALPSEARPESSCSSGPRGRQVPRAGGPHGPV